MPPRYSLAFISLPINTEKLLPYDVQSPTFQLKPLPSHLKHVCLGDNDTLLVINAKNLSHEQEEKF